MKMVSGSAVLAILALLVLSVPKAEASSHFFFQIGVPIPVAPVVVAPPPPPPPPYAYGYVWRAGYYSWNGYAYGWVPGVWVRPPFAGAVWVGPRWAAGPRGHVWMRGYWRR
jgi:hypothetical protein